MTATDREIIGNRHHDGGLAADPDGHPITDCSPPRCGLVAMTSPLPPCTHPDCEPDPATAVVVRNIGGPAAPAPYGLCAAHQWADALDLADSDDRAALALIALADTPIARADGLRERPLLLLAADPASGQVLGAWMDTAYSPAGLVYQIASRHTDGEDMTARLRDPGRWWLARVDRDHPAGTIHVDIDTAELAAVAHPDEFWVDAIGVCFNLTPGARPPAADFAVDAEIDEQPVRRTIAERQASEVRIALGLQAQLIAGSPRAVFHGVPDGDPGVGLITMEDPDGRVLDELANTGLFKSPSGFGWGGLGSGPAATARSLLTAALGGDAACPTCNGTRTVTMPDAGGEAASDYTCPVCDDGLRALPYHAYAHEVIAKLSGEWALTRGDVLRWLAGHTDPLHDAVRDLAAGMLS